MNQKFTNMSLEDLIDNVEFINWVRDDANESQWTQWLSNQGEHIESRFNIGRKMVSSLSGAPSSQDMNMQTIDDLWSRINTTIASKSEQGGAVTPGQGKIIKLLKPIVGVAAAVALLFFVFNQSNDSTHSFTTQDASMALTLPASSTVQLSADSKIDYDEENWGQLRNVKLEGTAHFDVTKGVPFKVETSLGNVKVLGTSFTVSEEGNTFVTQVSSGRVEVKSGSDTEILTKGMTYLRNPSAQDIYNYKGTDKTILRYKEVAIQEVLLGLSTLYEVTFEGREEDRDKVLNVIFDSKNLESALKRAFYSLDWEYEIRGKVVLIS